MIALCPEHASLADGGRWTKEQIREMKLNPFVSLGARAPHTLFFISDLTKNSELRRARPLPLVVLSGAASCTRILGSHAAE